MTCDRRRSLLTCLALFLLPTWTSSAPAASGIADRLVGKTTGETLSPGEFTPEGWKVTTESSQLRYDLGRLYSRGTVEFEIKGPLNQDEKRIIFAVWKDAAGGTNKATDPASFFQVRLSDEGMLLRMDDRAGPGRLEKHTRPLKWPGPNRWVKIKARWDANGGVSLLWVDGKEVRRGKFGRSFAGFRYAFLGRDNYADGYKSVPGLTFRNLRVYDLE